MESLGRGLRSTYAYLDNQPETEVPDSWVLTVVDEVNREPGEVLSDFDPVMQPHIQMVVAGTKKLQLFSGVMLRKLS